MDDQKSDERIKEAVREAYGSIARQFTGAPAATTSRSCCGGTPEPAATATKSAGCCGEAPAPATQAWAQDCCDSATKSAAGCNDTAARFYPAEELAGLPETVTGASLGCGNPLAIADLQPGEVVLDLGSGGGIDCFLAARKVGPQGRVIGLDMTPDMIKLARRNAKAMGVTNVDFRYGEMEEIPLADESVDAILSNCVINLSPDKDAVFHEAYRVLRPGGRLSVSDVVIDGDLPEAIRSRLDAWAGCLAGALDERDYLARIQAAGFERIAVLSREQAEVDDVAQWDDVQVVAVGTSEQEAKEELAKAGLTPSSLASKVASVRVRAYKPA
jgi:arsenite methyltransferase